jgi:hypothetical protein
LTKKLGKLSSGEEGERQGDWLGIGSEYFDECFLMESLWFTGTVSELATGGENHLEIMARAAGVQADDVMDQSFQGV